MVLRHSARQKTKTKNVENPSIDLGASRMRSGRSTNELIPQVQRTLFPQADERFIPHVIGVRPACSGRRPA